MGNYLSLSIACTDVMGIAVRALLMKGSTAIILPCA